MGLYGFGPVSSRFAEIRVWVRVRVGVSANRD